MAEFLFNMIPQSNHQYNTRSTKNVTTFHCRTDAIKYFYFPHTILECNKLDMYIGRSECLLSFKNSLLKIGQPTAKPTYNIYNPIGLKFFTRVRPGLSHLNKHNIKHNFQDCVNPLCLLSLEIESPLSFISALSSFHKHICNPIRWFTVSWYEGTLTKRFRPA